MRYAEFSRYWSPYIVFILRRRITLKVANYCLCTSCLGCSEVVETVYPRMKLKKNDAWRILSTRLMRLLRESIEGP